MIIQISGKLRQGKGILASGLGLVLADLGNEILSNYNLYEYSKVEGSLHHNVKLMDFYDYLLLLDKPRCEPQKTLLIDELPTWIDSYCSTTSESNRYASHFCNQSAKLGYDLIYTCQRTRRADINYREMADFSFKAVKNEELRQFDYIMLDPNVTDEDVETNQVLSIPFDMAAFWWDRYDTYEAVQPVGLKEFLQKMEKNDPKRMLSTVDRQVQKLKGKNVRFLPSVVAAELALMDVGESPVFAKYVKERLSSH